MSALTKEQWAEIEKHLSGMFGRVKLLCDGYEVTAEIRTVAPLRQGIAVYVGGYIKGSWIKGEAEEARKFHREKKSYLYSAKKREEAKAKMKSRRLPADIRKWYQDVATASVSVWTPYWTDPKAFTRHLRKTCADIQVVSMNSVF